MKELNVRSTETVGPAQSWDPGHYARWFLIPTVGGLFLLLPLSLLPSPFLSSSLPQAGHTERALEPELEMGLRLGLACNPLGPSLLSLPQAYERQVPPRAVINSAGYKILTSLDQYLELVGNSLPGKGLPPPRPRCLVPG